MPEPREPDEANEPAPEPLPPGAATAEDEADELFRQWDEAMAKREPNGEAAPAETPADAEADTFDIDAWLKGLAEAPTAEELAAHKSASEQLKHRLDVMQEARDSEMVLDFARHAIADLPGARLLPAQFVERWLQSEYQSNQVLREAWDGRYANQDAAHRAGRLAEKAVERLYNEISTMPDPKATSDRMAVALALRHGSERQGPAEVDWDAPKTMTDAEFEQFAHEQTKGTP